MTTLQRVIAWFDQNKVKRRSECVLAIGGGAMLDTVSLAAALYRRGTAFWRVPTTLLASIDAGIGVKSAVNFGRRKNLVGTYQAPARVLVDPLVLDSLPVRELRSGLGEALKLGLAADAPIARLLEDRGPSLITTRLQSAEGTALIERSIASMLVEIRADPWEENQLVHPTDLGHSFSRLFEEKLRPRVLHGEAVALDIAFSTACSEVVGLCTAQQRERILAIIAGLQLPTANSGITVSHLESAYDDIVVHRDGDRFPLPVEPGVTEIVQLKRSTLARAAKLAEA